MATTNPPAAVHAAKSAQGKPQPQDLSKQQRQIKATDNILDSTSTMAKNIKVSKRFSYQK